MRKNLLILLVGFVIGALLVGIVAITVVAKEKYKYGKYQGEVLTKLSIVKSLPAALGDDYRKEDGYQTLFEVKDEAVVIVERNGVKTLRVYRPGAPTNQGTATK
jgi:hypothetical protein